MEVAIEYESDKMHIFDFIFIFTVVTCSFGYNVWLVGLSAVYGGFTLLDFCYWHSLLYETQAMRLYVFANRFHSAADYRVLP